MGTLFYFLINYILINKCGDSSTLNIIYKFAIETIKIKVVSWDKKNM